MFIYALGWSREEELSGVIGDAAGCRSGDIETELGSAQDGKQDLGAGDRTLERSVRLGRLIAAGGREHRHELGLVLGEDRNRCRGLLSGRKGVAFGTSRKPLTRCDRSSRRTC
jgi:hypothetical protein